MSKEGTLITVGVLVLLTPFIGLPHSWFAWILPVLGIITLVIGQLMRKHRATPQTVRAEPSVLESVSAPTLDAPSPIA
jgi:hypothetical protein